MERLAFTVADSFSAHPGRRLLLAPGVGELEPPLRIGDRLRLVRVLDGSTILLWSGRCTCCTRPPRSLTVPRPARAQPRCSHGTAVWVATGRTGPCP